MTGMAAETAVEASGLTRRFGARIAVSNVDLAIRPGEFVALFGPNGAGKTTLLRLLCGLLRPSAGSIRILGFHIEKDPAPAKRRLAFLGHSAFLYPGLTARENLRFYARLYGVENPARRVDELLARVGLSERADDLVRAFSRGMLQRASIARTLLHDPEVVFLDEPFTGLDQEAGRTLFDLLAELRSRGRSVILVTHDLGEGLQKATRVLLLRRGRIVEDRQASGLTVPELKSLYDAATGAAPC